MIDQTMVNDFAPFKGVMTKIKGKYDPAYEIYLGLYQQLKGSDGRPDLYKTFPSDFFDLIVVDECHRGSAAEDSSWREVLSYFGSATQVGLTATPKNEKTIQNYEYFGEPVYTYSLKQGN
jgi:type I restriction enzyme R subunit